MPQTSVRQLLPSIALLALAALIATPAAADADRSPPPGGVYKVKPGIFVAEGARCSRPPNAAIRRYDGKGISSMHSRACIARILSKRRSGYGSLYKVSQSCIDAGTGLGKRFVERQTIDIPDALHFTMRSQGNTSYRYCPIRELPPGLRAAGWDGRAP
jgi:ABC-type proline/glycine betaine transport system permease subunit